MDEERIMKIQSSNITAVNTNMSSVQQKAQLSAEALQSKSVESGPSFSQRISDGLIEFPRRQNTVQQLARDKELGTEMVYPKLRINKKFR